MVGDGTREGCALHARPRNSTERLAGTHLRRAGERDDAVLPGQAPDRSRPGWANTPLFVSCHRAPAGGVQSVSGATCRAVPMPLRMDDPSSRPLGQKGDGGAVRGSVSAAARVTTVANRA